MTVINQNISSEFSVGKTLGRSFYIFSRNILPLVTIVILFQIPAVTWLVASGQYDINFDDPSTFSNINWIVHFGVIFLSVILSCVSTAAVTYGVFMDITGRKFTIGDCLSKSFSVLVPVIVMGVLVNILFFVGLALLIIPGVFVFLVLFVVFPVIIVEQPGIFDCLKRSYYLTKGNLWSLLGLSLVLLVISLGGGYLGQFLGTLFKGMGFDIVAVIVTTVAQSLYMAFWIIVGAVTYNNLRTIKEGISSDRIAAVFS